MVGRPPTSPLEPSPDHYLICDESIDVLVLVVVDGDGDGDEHTLYRSAARIARWTALLRAAINGPVCSAGR